MDAKTRDGEHYAALLPKLPLPPITEVDVSVLPEFWAEFCTEKRILPLAVCAYDNELGQMKPWGVVSMIRAGLLAGTHLTTDTMIDSTSGNEGEAAKWAVSKVLEQDSTFPVKHMKAVLPKSSPEAKIQRLLDRGIEPILAKDSLEAMQLARDKAKENGWWYLEQYWNHANSAGYEPIARHIIKQRPHLGAMACGVGSGGSCSGIMPVLRTLSRLVHRVAVVVEADQSVDGVRTEEMLKPGTLPWNKCIEDVRFVDEWHSLQCSAALWQQEKTRAKWCKGGPSTGFALEGGLLSLRSLAAMDMLEPLRNPDGYVELGFLAADMRDPYIAKYKKHSIYF